MKYNDLQVTTYKRSRRVGRGIAAGRGKTAGRGTKGQSARTGNGRRPGFEGGQNPLMQRLPKLPGFRSNTPKAENVYTGQLDAIGGVIDNFTLFNAGLVSSPHTRVKLVVKGVVTKKVSVKLQGASVTAVAAVQKAGGTFDAVPQVGRIKKDKSETKATKSEVKKK
ncbi:50S ribosomal protein L15 [Candidatus Saccharibacteria bacterium]|nr:50S ribosomal protein L15 [Candidatus Saccharibacteria bacterium]